MYTQVYATVDDDNEDAFHRTIFLFASQDVGRAASNEGHVVEVEVIKVNMRSLRWCKPAPYMAQQSVPMTSSPRVVMLLTASNANRAWCS